MEPILVYGFPSGSSMGLVAALEWLGRPYRLCRVDMLDEMRDPSYKRINPRVETPVLITDRGDPLTENMAIAAWLEARDSTRLISFEPLSREADRMRQFMAFINTGFTGAFTPLWAALEMETADPSIQSVLRNWGRDRVVERHDRLEEMIGDTPFLVSDHPTLADGFLIGVARWFEFHGLAGYDRWPKLAAIRKRIEAEAAVNYAQALENGEPQPGGGACAGHIGLAELIEQFGSRQVANIG